MSKTNTSLDRFEASQHGFACWCGFLTICLVVSSTVHAQQEQWLQYRTSPEAETIVGKTPGQEIKLTAVRPENLVTPEFSSPDPLLGSWQTPMVPAGQLGLALDCSGGNAPYDLLFVDTDANGSLTDEKPIRAYQSGAYGDRQSAVFRQVKVLLPGEDGPIEFHLDFHLRIFGRKRRYLVAKAAGWYESDVKIAGKRCHLTLFDANANGAFDDSFLDFQQSDRIKIAIGPKSVVSKVGKYIQVDERFYRFEVSPDGAFVRFSQPGKDALAALRVPSGLQGLSVGGQNGLFFLPISEELVRLPVGKYRLNHWELQRKDKEGNSWQLIAAAPLDGLVFKVGRNGQASLDVGEPLVATVSSSRRGSTYVFSDPALSGRHRERIMISCNGQKPPLPKLRIKNTDGAYDQRFSFEYG